MTLFAFAIVQPSQLYTQLELTLYTRSLSVRREKYGDKVKADATLLDVHVMRGMSIHPTADPLPTRFTPFLSTFPCLPVYLYIFFVAYERAIPLRVFPSSVPHLRTFSPSSCYLMRLLVTYM